MGDKPTMIWPSGGFFCEHFAWWTDPSGCHHCKQALKCLQWQDVKEGKNVEHVKLKDMFKTKERRDASAKH